MEEPCIHGCSKIAPRISIDQRGSFQSLLPDIFHEDGILIRQVCRSITDRIGTVRGLHLQLPPFAEMKLVFCTRGSVFDVAVDLREESETFLKVQHLILSEQSGVGIIIPPGVAHGFQALESNTEILYLLDSPYIPTASAGVHPCDPSLQIPWPFQPHNLSARDSSLPLIQEFLGKLKD